MEDRIKKANEFHKSGMNCSQSVVCAYCDLLGADEKTAYKLAEGFGAGMGIQSVCGALTGLIMLLGMQNSNGTPEFSTKASTYKLAKEASKKFEDKIGSIMCSEIKGINTGRILRSCNECIEEACKIAEEYLMKEKV